MTEEDIKALENMNKHSTEPWELEPDLFEFSHRGYECKAKRNLTTGAWCGYVGKKPRTNRYIDDEQQRVSADSRDELFDVHGGITFNDHDWLGFDCAHFGDYSPRLDGQLRMKKDYIEFKQLFGDAHAPVYRTLGYVVREICRLAEQLYTLEQLHGETL